MMRKVWIFLRCSVSIIQFPATTDFGNHGFVQKMKFCNLNPGILQIASRIFCLCKRFNFVCDYKVALPFFI